MATYFAKINEEVPVVPEELTQEVDQRKIDDIWSNMSMNLPLPPQYNGKNFECWSVRMNVFLCLVDCYHNLHDQERDALALQIIQQALDDSMLHKVATTTSLKEVWSILETEYSERGSNNLLNVSTLEEASVSEAELPEENNEGASVCEAELPEEEKKGASVCEAEHEKIAEIDGEAINTTTDIDEMIPVVFVDDNKGSTSMIFDEHCAEIGLFETEVRNLEIEFDDDNLSYDECLQIMEEKKKIDELMFGGGSLLGIQNQVDDLVTAEAVLERRFDDSSIQATTLMAANEAAEEEDNVDADLKWIEQVNL
jgi:hypothetical protein